MLNLNPHPHYNLISHEHIFWFKISIRKLSMLIILSSHLIPSILTIWSFNQLQFSLTIPRHFTKYFSPSYNNGEKSHASWTLFFLNLTVLLLRFIILLKVYPISGFSLTIFIFLVIHYYIFFQLNIKVTARTTTIEWTLIYLFIWWIRLK